MQSSVRVRLGGGAAPVESALKRTRMSLSKAMMFSLYCWCWSWGTSLLMLGRNWLCFRYCFCDPGAFTY